MMTERLSSVIRPLRRSIEGHGNEFDEQNPPIRQLNMVVGYCVASNVKISFKP
jgi:hypothetical protein